MTTKPQTIIFKETPRLGEGICLPYDVSQILKLPYHKVRYMMNTFWHGYTFGEKGNRAINFFALIEFYIYYMLREKGYTSTQIKKAHSQLAHDLKTNYPFVSVKILPPKGAGTQKSHIGYEHMGNIMRSDRPNQPSIKSFVELFLKHIEFDDNQLAKRYFPFGKKNDMVVVDPMHQFGQPVINGTNIQPQTIFTLYEAGETKNNISILYDISDKQVKEAIRYHRRKAA